MKELIVMKYQATKSFIGALKEWNDKTADFQVTDLVSLVFSINFQIGLTCRITPDDTADNRLIKLEERIIDLVENQKMSETFIVSSLSNYVTNYFKHNLMKHGHAILFHEKVASEHPELERTSKVVLDRLKAPGYYIKMKNEYHVWRLVVETYLSDEQMERWEDETLLDKSNDMKELGSEFDNMTFKEIYDKMNN
jgi:hypothetical protein